MQRHVNKESDLQPGSPIHPVKRDTLGLTRFDEHPHPGLARKEGAGGSGGAGLWAAPATRQPEFMGGDPHEFVPREIMGLKASLPCTTSVPLSGARRSRPSL